MSLLDANSWHLQPPGKNAAVYPRSLRAKLSHFSHRSLSRISPQQLPSFTPQGHAQNSRTSVKNAKIASFNFNFMVPIEPPSEILLPYNIPTIHLTILQHICFRTPLHHASCYLCSSKMLRIFGMLFFPFLFLTTVFFKSTRYLT